MLTLTFLLGTAVAFNTFEPNRHMVNNDQRLFVPNYGDEAFNRPSTFADRNRDGVPDVLQQPRMQPQMNVRPPQTNARPPVAQPQFGGRPQLGGQAFNNEPYWHFMSEPYQPPKMGADFEIHPTDIKFPLPSVVTREIGDELPEQFKNIEPEFTHVGPIPIDRHGIPARI